MKVQVVSDITCPWCRIGKANLRTAATAFTAETGEAVELEFLPFLLDPVTPEEEGEPFVERFIKRKGMPEAAVRQMFANVTNVGKNYGLTFDFDRIETAVNTVPAHELMELAPERAREPLMDALMTAYFEEGANVGDIDTLLRIARGCGAMDAADVNGLEQPLRKREMEPHVRSMIASAQVAGITGVPFFVIDGKLAVQGGQPPEAFADALRQARAS